MGRLRTVLFMLLLISLSACGFQLRSDASLPDVLGATRLIVTDQFSPFARQLQNSLRRAGVNLVAAAGQQQSSINVTVNRVSTEILTIGDTARVREYRITHRVEFTVLNAVGVAILPLQVLQQSRDLSFDEGELLAATREQEFVRDELSRNLVRLVVQRLGLLEST